MISSPQLSRRSFLGQAAALSASPIAAQKGKGPKIYVLWDMEGASGIFTREQTWYWEEGVRENVAAEARELFTADVNAVSTAALAAGASELIVGRKQFACPRRRSSLTFPMPRLARKGHRLHLGFPFSARLRKLGI